MNMMLSRAACTVTIACALVSTDLCGYVACFQSKKVEGDFIRAFEPIFANQPDFKADMTIVLADPIRMRIAKAKDKVRLEWFNPVKAVRTKRAGAKDYSTIVISRGGEPTLAFDPQQKTFTQMPSDFRPPVPEVLQLIKETLKVKETSKVVLEDVGTEVLDGRQVSKLRITSPTDSSGLFIYIAKGLRNLVVKLETGPEEFLGGKRISYKLSNISLDVPHIMFEYPSGYRKVGYETFMATFKQNTSR
jgi:hypothetical protein